MRFPLVTRRRYERELAFWRQAHHEAHACWAVQFRNAWRFKHALGQLTSTDAETQRKVTETLQAEESQPESAWVEIR